MKSVGAMVARTSLSTKLMVRESPSRIASHQASGFADSPGCLVSTIGGIVGLLQPELGSQRFVSLQCHVFWSKPSACRLREENLVSHDGDGVASNQHTSTEPPGENQTLSATLQKNPFLSRVRLQDDPVSLSLSGCRERFRRPRRHATLWGWSR